MYIEETWRDPELACEYSESLGGIAVYSFPTGFPRYEGDWKEIKEWKQTWDLVCVIPHGDADEGNAECQRLIELQLSNYLFEIILPDNDEVRQLLPRARLARLQLLREQILDEHGWQDTGRSFTPSQGMLAAIEGIVADTYDQPFPIRPRRLVDARGNVMGLVNKPKFTQ